MNTEEYVEAIEGMDSDTLEENFEALMALALSIEENEGEENES